VVHPRALDVRSVTLGRRVAQGEQQGAGRGDVAEGVAEQQGGQQFGAAGEGGEEVVVGGEAQPHPRGAGPTGDGAAALGEQGAGEQDAEAEGVALVEGRSQTLGEVLPEQRQGEKIHGGSPGRGRGLVATPILAREPFSGQKATPRLLIGD
jgi:hypothetical protein